MSIADKAAGAAKDIAETTKDATDRARDVTSDVVKRGGSPIAWLSSIGVRSEHAYLAAFVSIGFSFAAWALSRGKRDSRDQSDRWGLFVGEWAPTLFAIGIALKNEER